MVSALEQRHIRVKLVARNELAAEALNGHVGQREQVVEDDAVARCQLFLVGLLQSYLVGRQGRPKRVVDEVEHPPAVRQAVAQVVELAQPVEAGLENAIAALLVDVLFQITGQRGGDFNRVIGEERRQRLVARFVENGQVAAIDHAQPHRPRFADQPAEVRVHLRRPAGQIKRLDRLPAGEVEQHLHGFPAHFLGALRTGRHVTMKARLVAAIAEIGLQRLQHTAADRREIGFDQQRKSVAHRGSPEVSFR